MSAPSIPGMRAAKAMNAKSGYQAPNYAVVQLAELIDANTNLPELIEALRDLLNVILADELIPESVNYMRAARTALDKCESGT